MNVFPTTIGDDLLRWASEAGSGNWERLRDVCSYLTDKHERNRRPWIIASELSQLGHIDIDWNTRTWSVAPPVLNLVPGLGICLVLTGSRPHHVNERFEEATNNMDVYPFEVAQNDAPRAKFAKCASVEIAQVTARRLNSRLVIDPARQLLSALKPVDEIPLTRAAPPPLDEVEKFDIATLEWRSDDRGQPGLYRLDLHGRKAHRLLDQSGIWWVIDLPIGQFRELKTNPRPVVRWRPPSGDIPARFEVRRELSLPLIAERALVTSSGLLPKQSGDWRSYANVPKHIAHSIASLLLSTLTVH